MESADHRWLKHLGAALLLESGCSAVAVEVRCPIHRFRVDVAGYLDPLPKRSRSWVDVAQSSRNGGGGDGGDWPAPLFLRRRGRPFTCLIECKQSRADFLRDRRDVDALMERRALLERERREIERTRIPEREPHLRRSGTSLFPELEEWDFSASRDEVYLALLRELDRIDRRLHGQTKFTRAARYRLADALLLLSPAGLIRPEEVPPGWGLLEAGPGAEEIRIAVAAPEHEAGDRHRQRTLRNIAIAATRRALALPDLPVMVRNPSEHHAGTSEKPEAFLEQTDESVD